MPQLFIHDGTTFFLNLEMKSAIMFFWVSTMLSASQAGQYSAELKIGSAPNTDGVRVRERENKSRIVV
jgi:hypothetical protein